ncbi:hypothetical protein BHE74_00026123 [Ensete ventricosum]|nr:hypothetical protein BHE74_00026123 [Ensete ventricosum]
MCRSPIEITPSLESIRVLILGIIAIFLHLAALPQPSISPPQPSKAILTIARRSSPNSAVISTIADHPLISP